MKLAILLRTEDNESHKPFNRRYYLVEYFKEIFDKLDILLFPVVSDKNLKEVCELCDGLIVTGNRANIPPRYYGEEPIPGSDYSTDEFRTDREAIKLFYDAKKPILGICGGMQSINVCFGGSLNQAIDNHKLIDKTHNINLKEGSFLYGLYNEYNKEVNSFHTQSVKNVARGFEIAATADDGTIEAIERGNIIAVQWHPEAMGDVQLFRGFVDAFLRENNTPGKRKKRISRWWFN